jgi:LysR family hydrogen peroxide-inducible transcriptional activator
MVSKENKLAKSKEIHLDQLDFDEMIFLEKGNCLTDDVQKVCQFQENKKSLKAAATSIETLRYLVSYFNSYSLIPKLSVLHSENIDKMVDYKPLKQSKFGREVILVARKSYPFAKNLKALREFFKGISLGF